MHFVQPSRGSYYKEQRLNEMTGVLPRLIQVLKVIHCEDDHILHGCALILLKPTWYQRVLLFRGESEKLKEAQSLESGGWQRAFFQ